MGRPRTDEAKIERAVHLVDGGERAEDAAAAVGISHSVLKRELRRRRAATATQTMKTQTAPVPQSAPRASQTPSAPQTTDARPPIDAEADPLVVARALLARTSHDISMLSADSPRMNPARAELRAIVKMIEAFERTRAAVETPEEAERKRRVQDGETRRLILEVVEKAEAVAREKGVCVHCGAPLARGAAEGSGA